MTPLEIIAFILFAVFIFGYVVIQDRAADQKARQKYDERQKDRHTNW